MSAKKKETRGGARKGAGRKPRDGAKVVTSSISMMPEDWARLDAMRGERSRGAVVRDLLRDASL